MRYLQTVEVALISQRPAVQAVADARGAADAQAAWLRAHMGPHFSRKLLRITREIQKHVGLHDGRAAHRFPRLAGSHLSEVPAPLAEPRQE